MATRQNAVVHVGVLRNSFCVGGQQGIEFADQLRLEFLVMGELRDRQRAVPAANFGVDDELALALGVFK